MSPLEQLKTRLPALFERGVTLLRERAAGGDGPRAQTRLEDVTGARSAVRIVAEGGGGAELWLAVDGGQLTASDTRPESVPVRLAVAVPTEAMDVVLGRLAEASSDDDAEALAVARTASKKAESVLEGQRLDFHVIIEGSPELGDVVSRVSVGSADPPDEPRFTATVRYDDLEAAREGGVDPQQFLMGGRVRFAGDYVPALQVGMQLAQVMKQ